MKKYDDLWRNINNLLTYLRYSDVVKKVDDYYLGQFDNDTPGKLLQMEIDELQGRLDNAEKD